MAKRFTDTTLYDKAWYRQLPPRLKCAWEWLCKRCDVIGVWDIDMGRLSFEVGETVTMEELQEAFEVQPFDGDKLFLPKFVPFQYGDDSGRLSPKNKFHLSIAAKLEAQGLPRPEFKTPVDTLSDPMGMGVDTLGGVPPTPQGKGKGKGQGQGQGQGEEGKGGTGENPPSRQPITERDVQNCSKAWGDTLTHFRASRALTEKEHLLIGKAIQEWGAKAVELAIIGARFEQKTETFDPAKNFSLSRALPLDVKSIDGREKKFEKFMNLGAQAVTTGKARLQDAPQPPQPAHDPADEEWPEVNPEAVRAILAQAGFA